MTPEEYLRSSMGPVIYSGDVIEAQVCDIAEVMQEFADKMVSERLREELIAYKTYENIFDNKHTTVTDLIDEYLKNRER